MRVLVTGSSGFIGGALSKKLIEDGYDVVGFDVKLDGEGTEFIQGDIASYSFDKVLKNVDVVFHLAGLLGTTELFHRIIDAEKVNVLGTLNLLEAMRKNNIKKIIFTSKPNVWKYNVYTITKENCERYLKMYREIYGFKPIITRPYNVYGPNEYLIEYRKAIPYFIVSALKGKPLEVFGSGQQIMDPIYIDDVVDALIRCSTIDTEETIEIGSGTPIKVIEIAKTIIDLCESESEIIHLPMRRGEFDSGKLFSNKSLKRIIGFEPKISLNEGLKKTICWYDRHIEEFNEIYKFTEKDFVRDLTSEDARKHAILHKEVGNSGNYVPPMKFELINRDKRGEMWVAYINEIAYWFLMTRMGHGRGGGIRDGYTYNAILRGSFSVRQMINGEEDVRIIKAPAFITIPPETPHVFIALEDSYMLEWHDHVLPPYKEKRFYPPYRRLCK